MVAWPRKRREARSYPDCGKSGWSCCPASQPLDLLHDIGSLYPRLAGGVLVAVRTTVAGLRSVETRMPSAYFRTAVARPFWMIWKFVCPLKNPCRIVPVVRVRSAVVPSLRKA